MNTINKNKKYSLLWDLTVAYRSYIASPSPSKLKKFIDLSEKYSDIWVDSAGELLLTNGSKDQESDKQIFGDDNEINNVIIGAIKNLDSNNPYQFSDSYFSSSDLTEEFSLGPYKAEFKDAFKLMVNEIGRVSSEDKSSKIVTYSASLNQPLWDESMASEGVNSFYGHKIISSRFNDKKQRRFNRRWYFEDLKNDPKAWWGSREVFQLLIERANDLKMFANNLDNPNVTEVNMISSFELGDEEYMHHLSEISLEAERKTLIDKDYDFIIIESRHNKIADFSNADLDSEKTFVKFEFNESILWRDVCIMTPSEITFRSLTNSKIFKPAVPILGTHWVIANQMLDLPNQILKKFIKVLMPNFTINH